MQTAVHINLGAPRMIYYIATHSVVRDRKYTATQGVVHDGMRESREGRAT